MFLTMESARLPCCTTFSRLPFSICVSSSISSRVLSSSAAGLSTSFSSSINSADSAEKLLTKLSGFLISCAMPAGRPGGEGLPQGDLGGREWARPRPCEREHAFNRAIAHQRHRESRAIAAEFGSGAEIVFGVEQHVRQVRDLAVHEDAAGEGVAALADRVLLKKFDHGGRKTGFRVMSQQFAITQENNAGPGSTQRLRGLGQCGEHGFEIERRAADDLEHVGGRGLLLQGLAQIIGALAQFPQQSCVFYCDDRLLGEILDQCDLLRGK